MTSILGWNLLVLGIVGVLINGPAYIRIKLAAHHMHRKSENDGATISQAIAHASEYYGGLLAMSLVFLTVGAFLVLR